MLLGNGWDDKLAFGIVIFHFWIRLYYQGQHSKKLNELYEIFEKNLR